MRKYYIKLVTGFREDQEISIPMQEAHKAYYIFKNPEKRTIFENGVALIGTDIRQIKPDWNKTMGWNETHKLESADWNQINDSGVAKKMTELIEKSQDLVKFLDKEPNLVQIKMGQVIKLLEGRKQLASPLENSEPQKPKALEGYVDREKGVFVVTKETAEEETDDF